MMIDNIDLPTIVPILSEAGLLTKHEQERLLNNLIRSDMRVMELVGTLSKKGSGCVRQFMECLRKETVHQGHRDLLCSMEQSFGHTQEEAYQAPPPACSLEMQKSSTPACLGSLYHPTTHTCQGSQHDSHFILPLNCTPSIVCMYQDTISHLAHVLSVRNVPLESILKVAQQLLSMNIATQITDFISLHSYLVNNGICGPTDVDFLVALLAILEQHDLAGLVLDYAVKIRDENVFTTSFQSIDLTVGSDENFRLFTGYQHDAARVCEVWDLKETLSNLLGIPRHHFCFAGSQLSPFLLVWQFPSALAEQCTAVLCENQSQLVSKLSINSVPCYTVQYWFHGHHYMLFLQKPAVSHQLHPTSSLVHIQPGPSATTADARALYHGLGELF